MTATTNSPYAGYRFPGEVVVGVAHNANANCSILDSKWDSPRGRGADMARRLRQHDHFRANTHTIVEVDHILVGHADAPRGDRLADGLGLVRAVDAIERPADVQGASAKRIVGSA